jgi:putative acetyltransferase
MSVEIDTFRSEHARRFAELNRQWLESYNLMEPAEEEQLADPQKHFLDCGGQIFVALHNGQVVGTCAVIPHRLDAFELAKLTVSPEFRGQGIARRLVQRCIAYAREQGAKRVILVSNSQLRVALGLYESLGFRYCPVPEVTQYKVADVCMVLDLDSAHTPRA